MSTSSSAAAVAVHVASVLSPSSFVVCARRAVGSASTAAVRAVQDVEVGLDERLGGRAGIPEEEVVNDLLQEGKQVAVRRQHGWVRGRVDGVTRMGQDRRRAAVFLLDWGQTVAVESPATDLRPLLAVERAPPPLAHPLVLFGLQPLEVELDPGGRDGRTVSRRLGHEWSPEAARLVRALVEAAESVELVPRQEGLPSPPYYGDLIVVLSSRELGSLARFERYICDFLNSTGCDDLCRISLSNVLLENDFAASVGRKIHRTQAKKTEQKTMRVSCQGKDKRSLDRGDWRNGRPEESEDDGSGPAAARNELCLDRGDESRMRTRLYQKRAEERAATNVYHDMKANFNKMRSREQELADQRPPPPPAMPPLGRGRGRRLDAEKSNKPGSYGVLRRPGDTGSEGQLRASQEYRGLEPAGHRVANGPFFEEAEVPRTTAPPIPWNELRSGRRQAHGGRGKRQHRNFGNKNKVTNSMPAGLEAGNANIEAARREKRGQPSFISRRIANPNPSGMDFIPPPAKDLKKRLPDKYHMSDEEVDAAAHAFLVSRGDLDTEERPPVSAEKQSRDSGHEEIESAATQVDRLTRERIMAREERQKIMEIDSRNDSSSHYSTANSEKEISAHDGSSEGSAPQYSVMTNRGHSSSTVEDEVIFDEKDDEFFRQITLPDKTKEAKRMQLAKFIFDQNHDKGGSGRDGCKAFHAEPVGRKQHSNKIIPVLPIRKGRNPSERLAERVSPQAAPKMTPKVQGQDIDISPKLKYQEMKMKIRSKAKQRMEMAASVNAITNDVTQKEESWTTTSSASERKRSQTNKRRMGSEVASMEPLGVQHSHPALSPSCSRLFVFDQDPTGRRVRSVETVSELSSSLTAGIHQNLAAFLQDERVVRAFTLQQAMWPSVAMGRSFVGVAAPGHGKTVGYLIPLVNHILTAGSPDQDFPYPRLAGAGGEAPLAVVVAATWKKAVSASSVLDRIIKQAGAQVPSNGQELRALLVFEKEELARVQLMNGCHVLVTTPRSLLRLLLELKTVSLSRCCHLVFDDADVSFEASTDAVRAVMGAFEAVHEARPGMLKQVVVTSSTWSVPVEEFIRRYLMPKNVRGCSVGVANPFDCALYGKVKTVPYFAASDIGKLALLEEILTRCGRERRRRCLILCRDSKSGQTISTHLEAMGLDYFFIHENLEDAGAAHLVTKRLLEKWNARLARHDSATDIVPLVLTDSAMLEHTQAETIIHYDLPSASKKMFGMRYWHLHKCFASLYEAKSGERTRGVSHILLSPRDRRAIKTLFPFLKSDPSCQVPGELEQFYLNAMVRAAEEKKLAAVPVCAPVKVTGRCFRRRVCPKRHFFDRALDWTGETAANLVNAGVVSFRVTEMLDPVHFLVKLQCLSWKGKRTDFRKLGGRLALKLFNLNVKEHKLKPLAVSTALGISGDRLIYPDTTQSQASSDEADSSEPRKRSPLEQHHVGLPLFLTRGGRDNGFKRVEIVSSQKDENEDTSLLLLFVDEGFHEWKRDVRLYAMPDDICEAEFPRQSVEVILAGLRPKDSDVEWSNTALRVSKEHMLDSQGDDDEAADVKVFSARVWLGLRNTIWVRRICRVGNVAAGQDICEEGATSRVVVTSELRRHLLQNGLADENPQHFDQLQGLCEKAGLVEAVADGDDLDETAGSADAKGTTEPVEERRAFLETGRINEVVVTEVFSPGHFFVRRLKFDRQLKQIEKDLEAAMEKEEGDVQAVELGEGELCAAKVEDESDPYWVRAKIVKELDGAKFEITLVDYGTTEEVQCVRPIPPGMVKRLPFQAVECGLFNVAPVGDGWSREAGDLLFETAGDGAGGEATLSALVVAKEISKISGYDCYKVSLSLPSGALIENKLIDEGLAAAEDETKVFRAENFLDSGDSGVVDGFGQDAPEEEEVERAPPPPPQAGNRSLSATTITKAERRKDPGPKPVAQVEERLPVPECKWRKLETPGKMPALAAVEGLTEFESRPLLHGAWSQSEDKLFLSLNIKLDLTFDLDQRFLHIDLESGQISCSYLEILQGLEEVSSGGDDGNRQERALMHGFKELTFSGQVDPQASDITFGKTGFSLKIRKRVKAYWKSLFADAKGQPVKPVWLDKKVHGSGRDSSSEGEGEEQGETSYHLSLPELTEAQLEELRSSPAPDLRLPDIGHANIYKAFKPEGFYSSEDEEEANDQVRRDMLKEKVTTVMGGSEEDEEEEENQEWIG